MSSERDSRFAEVLFAVLELPDEEHSAFLEKECSGDEHLIAELRACLASEQGISRFLEQPAARPGAGDFARSLRDVTGSSELMDERTEVAGTGSGAARPEPAGEAESSVPIDDVVTLAEGAGRRLRPPPEPDAAAGGGGGGGDWQLPLGRSRLGAYPIVGHLGAGGMGQVYIGEDRRLGRRVAIKVLPVEMAERPGWLERFEREARALAALNHPNIVTIHSIEQDAGLRFLTMEMVEGETLSEAIPDDGLPVEDFLHIAKQLTDALAAAHDRGVVHRDLKPANVMLNRDGRVKILDFGIAKLAAPDQPAVSKQGVLLGTVSFMAPEQLRGETADARSDLFSLGVVFYVMATGRHPFPADNTFERISTILNLEQSPVDEVRPELPRQLAAILERCLEKDPHQRYQSTGELRHDLAELRQGLYAEKLFESRTDLGTLEPKRRSPWAVVATTLGLVIALTVLFLRGTPDPRGTPGGAVEVAEKPRKVLAVLFFQNLTEDPSLDWLQTGISKLLVTDLSQSPDLRVLGTGEIQELLEHAGGLGEAPLGAEQIRRVAEHSQAEAVVHGSFAKLGETLTIAFSVEQPAGGQVLAAASFEGQGEGSMFGLVDQVSEAVLLGLGAAEPEIGPRNVEDMTTDSVAAWQAFTRAKELYMEQAEPEAAIEGFEQALRFDPDFALAHANLARIHQSQGRTEKARQHSLSAVELADHLPLTLKFNTVGNYYGSQWATLGRAIETYDIALKVYPDAAGWRNNLARRYAFFERYEEAIREFEAAIGPKEDFWGNYYGAANAYAALGDWQKGHDLLTDFAARHPEHWLIHYSLAWHLTEGGKYRQAAEAFELVAELRPQAWQKSYGLWRLEVLKEEWSRAEIEARELTAFEHTFARWRGRVALARNALYRGASTRALESLREAIEQSVGADRALALCFEAEVRLARGEAEQALETARLAQEEGRDQWPELRGIFLAALAEQQVGRPAEADALHDVLRERWRRQPNAVEERQLHHLAGLLALARGDLEAASSALHRAAALLPPRGIEFSWHVFPHHVPIWTALGEVELQAGRPRQAVEWLSKASSSGSEHLERPLPYVLSHYHEGLARHRSGDRLGARKSFEKFLGYWRDGDLYAQRVELARSFLQDGAATR